METNSINGLDCANDSRGISELLSSYEGLSVVRCDARGATLSGRIIADVSYRGKDSLRLDFTAEIFIPTRFPRELPVVRDRCNFVPKDHHVNPDGTLCLGAPITLLRLVSRSPRISTFVEKCLLPFYYRVQYYQLKGIYPFGELAHGAPGLLNEYRALFNAQSDDACLRYLKALSQKKRTANKALCPCGSGKRLGRCHNRKVNAMRHLASRSFFNRQLSALIDEGRANFATRG